MPQPKKIIKVLLIGFDVVIGVSMLSPQPASDTDHAQVDITYYNLPASYPSFSSNIPALHESGEYDAFLHIGQAEDHACINLEKGARRVGYTAPYPDGLVPDLVDEDKGKKGHGLPKGEENEQDEYKPIVDLDGMEKWLRDNIGVKVMQSDDAGLVGCEFTFATSLRAAIQHARKTGTRVKPVLFIHTPNLLEDKGKNAIYDANHTMEWIRACCWWMGQEAVKVQTQDCTI